MNIEEKLEKCNAELDLLRKQYKSIGDKIQLKAAEKEKLLLEINKDNLNDPKWLIRNPTMPGAHEGMQKLVKDNYGGEYNGPHPSGYHHDGNYKPIQQNFDFCLQVYDKHEKRILLKKNCDHFIENFMSMLDPVANISSRWDDKFPDMNVVPFQFRSEDYGLDYLGYEPVEGAWYHYTMRYGSSNTERKFKNWDEAFNFAYELANRKERDEDY